MHGIQVLTDSESRNKTSAGIETYCSFNMAIRNHSSQELPLSLLARSITAAGYTSHKSPWGFAPFVPPDADAYKIP